MTGVNLSWQAWRQHGSNGENSIAGSVRKYHLAAQQRRDSVK